MTLLHVDAISVSTSGNDTILHPVSLTLEPGEPLVVLGETGSGKSLLVQAIMGTLPDDLWAEGTVSIDGRQLDAAKPAGFRALWGRRVSVLPQEPWLSLDPLMRAQKQVAEVHQLVGGFPGPAAADRAESDLTSLDLAGAGGKYPHQLSGGMAQRVAFAAARAGGANIVIADEPTKGLDAARRDEVARLLLSGMGATGGLLVITHDLALAQMIGGRAMVIRDGRVVEANATADLFDNPQTEYTRHLVQSDPVHWPKRSTRSGQPVATATGLGFARGGRNLARDLAFEIKAGEILGISGPSGCGKSTLGDVILGLHAPDAGRMTYQAEIQGIARQKLYQDPVAAFPPRRFLKQTINDVAKRFGSSDADIASLMDRLGLFPILLDRFPDQVSGGELQRLSLLRVMLTHPKLIFADEPTSRLDPITQKTVMDVLGDLADGGCAIILVSHDLALLGKMADATLALSETK
ncbi:MAG: ABC transporter ATP-binding protein [Rhodospirillaceae bacterium]|nr:ABC transporter ATP-binding protein [Rhodospirillaceae bacterium]